MEALHCKKQVSEVDLMDETTIKECDRVGLFAAAYVNFKSGVPGWWSGSNVRFLLGM
jgi:hypothetical protein